MTCCLLYDSTTSARRLIGGWVWSCRFPALIWLFIRAVAS